MCKSCCNRVGSKGVNVWAALSFPFPPLWYSTGTGTVSFRIAAGRNGHASARVCRTKLYCRTLPYSLHSIGRIMYGMDTLPFCLFRSAWSPAAKFHFIFIFFLFPLLTFPSHSQKPCQWEGEEIKLERKGKKKKAKRTGGPL